MPPIVEYSDEYNPSAPVLEITIQKPGKARKSRTIQALLDTGADATMLPLEILKDVGAEYRYSGTMRGIMGQRFSVGIYIVTLIVGELSLRGVRVIGIPNDQEEPIIGRDVLNRLKILLDGPEQTLEIFDA